MRGLGFPRSAVGCCPRSGASCAASVEHGLKVRPVRWLMLAAPFTFGVAIYVSYALQPYLLQLWGDPSAYGIAGLARRCWRPRRSSAA
jgi:hypothetical protein